MLGSRREVLVDVLLARDRRDSGRGDRGVPSGALVRRAERGVRSRQNLGLGVRPAPGARGTQGEKWRKQGAWGEEGGVLGLLDQMLLSNVLTSLFDFILYFVVGC